MFTVMASHKHHTKDMVVVGGGGSVPNEGYWVLYL